MSGGSDILDPEYVRKTLRILWRERALVSLSAVVGTASFAVLALVLPPTFRAHTTLIPVSSQSPGGTLGQLAFGFEDFGLALGVGNAQISKYPEIVKSRRLLLQSLLRTYATSTPGDSVRLIDVVQSSGRGEKRFEHAIRKLRSAVRADVDRRSGILTISVDLRDPVVAAGVANELARALQMFMIQSFASQAGESRKFIESRLVGASKDLASAEEQLRAFRERNLRFGNAPHLQLELGRLERSLREQEDVYLTLKRQFELARIQEFRDVPVINPLDKAVPPATRTAPKRTLLTLFGAGLGAAIGMWVAFGRTK